MTSTVRDFDRGLFVFIDRWVFGWLLVFMAALCFSTALMEISFALSGLGWLFLKIRFPRPLLFERKLWGFLLGFVVLSVLSFFWSEFKAQSFRGIFKVLQQFILFWIAGETLITPGRQKKALQILIVMFLVLGLDGIWQYVSGRDLLRGFSLEMASSGRRISASFHNYGLLAAFAILFLPLEAAEMGERGKKAGVFVLEILALGLGILLIFWTRVRGAWVAFWLGSMFYFWLLKRRILLVLVILLPLISVFFLPRSMLIHLDIEKKEQSLFERFYLWDRAVQVIRERPWTGTGINTYAVAHQKYDRRQSWRGKNYYAHNGYLQIAAETGLPSLACFLAFLFFYFRNGLLFLRKEGQTIRARELLGVLSGLLNFLILGMIDTIFHNPQVVMGFWFLAGWGIALQRVTAVKPSWVEAEE